MSSPSVITIPVGELRSNAYYLRVGDDGVLIDPGAEASRILASVEQAGGTPRAIVLTHAHFDHIGAIAEVKAVHDVPVYVHEAEADFLTRPELNFSVLFEFQLVAPPADATFCDRQPLRFGSIEIEPRHTPGHSPGGCALVLGDHGICFCGDALFAGSVGRTDFAGGSHQTLIEAIGRQILALPDDTQLYPGHGPATTVARERDTNPYLTEFARS